MSEQGAHSPSSSSLSEPYTPPRRSQRPKKPRKLDYDAENEGASGNRDELQEVTNEDEIQKYQQIGSSWTQEELQDFFTQYKSKEDIKIRGRTPEQLQALKELHSGVMDTLPTSQAFASVHQRLATLIESALATHIMKSPTKRRKQVASASSSTTSTPTRSKRKTTASAQSTPSRKSTATPTKEAPVYVPNPNRYRKQKIEVSPLPPDALIVHSSNTAQEESNKNKRLPIKLRGKGTHGSSKVNVQVVYLNEEGNEVPQEGSPEDEMQIDQTQLEQLGIKLRNVLTTVKARKFYVCEWFYPSVDYGYFKKNEFLEWVSSQLPLKENMTRSDWTAVRYKLNLKPKRLSQTFLNNEKSRLYRYRQAVRLYYRAHVFNKREDDESLEMQIDAAMHQALDEYDVLAPMQPGDRVLARNVESGHVSAGTVVGVRFNCDIKKKKKNGKRKRIVELEPYNLDDLSASLDYSVQLDSEQQSQPKVFSDLHIMSLGPLKVLSTSVERQLRLAQEAQQMQQAQTPDHLSTPTKRTRTNPSTPNVSTPVHPSQTVSLRDQASVLQMAQCIIHLKRKDKLLAQITQMNNEAEEMTKQGKEVAEEFRIRYAQLLVQLKNLDLTLVPILRQLQRFPQSTVNTPARNSSSTKVSHYDATFWNNRTNAGQLVEKLKAGNLETVASPGGTKKNVSKISSLWNGSNVISTITECVAFMYHLQTCISDNEITCKDASLMLEAALMALKPKGISSTEAEVTEDSSEAIYEEIGALVRELKSALMDSSVS